MINFACVFTLKHVLSWHFACESCCCMSVLHGGKPVSTVPHRTLPQQQSVAQTSRAQSTTKTLRKYLMKLQCRHVMFLTRKACNLTLTIVFSQNFLFGPLLFPEIFWLFHVFSIFSVKGSSPVDFDSSVLSPPGAIRKTCLIIRLGYCGA